jgi:dinuclear metal center YbgI/SA1388 family protein
MTKIKEIINVLEAWAPLKYQEDYDNAGLIVGNNEVEITNILITLDVTEEVVAEAITKNANLILAHHPIIFKGLKKLNGKNYIERTVIAAIKNDIAIYACHTNLDNVSSGVNRKIGEKIGLKNIKILKPKSNTLRKLVVFVPADYHEKVLEALFEAGAGKIGNYENCSFVTEGIGSFKPIFNAKPFIGKLNTLEKVAENKIEVIFPFNLQQNIIETLKLVHPYEEIAYYLTSLENENQEVGAGAIGELENEMTQVAFLKHLKDTMNLELIKYTPIANKKIKYVAVCGGVGSFLLHDALAAKADAFVTADYKYHEYFDSEGEIMIADIGHYESEVFTKELIHFQLSKKFTNFAVLLSEVNTNPVKYYF